MNKLHFKYFYFLLLSGLMLSCNSLTDPDSIDPIELINIDQEFEIDLQQVLTPNVPIFYFKVTSLTEHNCEDAILNSSMDQTGQDLNIVLPDVFAPQPCANTGSSFPSNKHYLDEVQTESSKSLKVQVLDLFVNEGTIIQSATGVQFDLETTSGLEIVRYELLAVPKNVMWGYFEIDDPLIAEQAVERLTKYSDQVVDFPSGDYGYFEHLGSNLIDLDLELASYAQTYLLESNNLAWPNVRAALESIKLEYPELKAVFWNWNGDRIEY